MIRPDIKSFHSERQDPFIAPMSDRSYFLGRNARELHWLKKNPRVNIRHEGSIFEIQVALPGFEKEEVKVLIADDILTIVAEKKEDEGYEGSEYVLNEFDVDRLERKFRLAKNIAYEKVEAEFRNGMLKISFIDVPEAEEEKKFKKIPVL